MKKRPNQKERREHDFSSVMPNGIVIRGIRANALISSLGESAKCAWAREMRS